MEQKSISGKFQTSLNHSEGLVKEFRDPTEWSNQAVSIGMASATSIVTKSEITNPGSEPPKPSTNNSYSEQSQQVWTDCNTKLLNSWSELHFRVDTPYKQRYHQKVCDFVQIPDFAESVLAPYVFPWVAVRYEFTIVVSIQVLCSSPAVDRGGMRIVLPGLG